MAATFIYGRRHLPPGSVYMFKQVLKWLDAGAPHKDMGDLTEVGFHMEYFQRPKMIGITVQDQAQQDCGTACCIAGVIYAQNPELGEDLDIHHVGHKLGLSPRQWNLLFYATDEDATALPHQAGSLMDLREITPSMAAATIRRFLRTGEISWRKDE